MNSNAILSEGFFDKLFKHFKIDKDKKDTVKSSKTMKKKLKNLNSAVSELEKAVNDRFGGDINLDKFELKDFK